MKKILIISQSSLGSSFKSKYDNIYSIDTYHNFDMKDKEDCIKLTEKIYDYDVLIITTGSHTGDLWDIVSVNFTGPCYIISELVKNNFKGQIIYIGSYGSVWTSWPGIPIERLIYNTSKLSSKKFIQGLEHSKISNTRLTILNPSKFKTKMSQFQGMEVNEIINIIKWIVDSSYNINITNIEFTEAK